MQPPLNPTLPPKRYSARTASESIDLVKRIDTWLSESKKQSVKVSAATHKFVREYRATYRAEPLRYISQLRRFATTQGIRKTQQDKTQQDKQQKQAGQSQPVEKSPRGNQAGHNRSVPSTSEKCPDTFSQASTPPIKNPHPTKTKTPAVSDKTTKMNDDHAGNSTMRRIMGQPKNQYADHRMLVEGEEDISDNTSTVDSLSSGSKEVHNPYTGKMVQVPVTQTNPTNKKGPGRISTIVKKKEQELDEVDATNTMKDDIMANATIILADGTHMSMTHWLQERQGMPSTVSTMHKMEEKQDNSTWQVATSKKQKKKIKQTTAAMPYLTDQSRETFDLPPLEMVTPSKPPITEEQQQDTIPTLTRDADEDETSITTAASQPREDHTHDISVASIMKERQAAVDELYSIESSAYSVSSAYEDDEDSTEEEAEDDENEIRGISQEAQTQIRKHLLVDTEEKLRNDRVELSGQLDEFLRVRDMHQVWFDKERTRMQEEYARFQSVMDSNIHLQYDSILARLKQDGEVYVQQQLQRLEEAFNEKTLQYEVDVDEKQQAALNDLESVSAHAKAIYDGRQKQFEKELDDMVRQKRVHVQIPDTSSPPKPTMWPGVSQETWDRYGGGHHSTVPPTPVRQSWNSEQSYYDHDVATERPNWKPQSDREERAHSDPSQDFEHDPGNWNRYSTQEDSAHSDPRPAPQTSRDREYHLRNFTKAPLPMAITAANLESAQREYGSFHNFATTYWVPLLHWHEITKGTLSLYPTTEPPQYYMMYSKALYAKLEEDGAIDDRNSILTGIMLQYNSERDGYRVLREFTRQFVGHVSVDLVRKNIMPAYKDSKDIFQYAGRLTLYFAEQTKNSRRYPGKEQSGLYLANILSDKTYGKFAQRLLTKIEDLRDAPLDNDHALGSLPTTLEMMRKAYSPNIEARVNKMRAGTQGQKVQWSGQNAPGQGEKRKNCQCKACGVYGHEVDTCNMLPKVQLCAQYIKDQPATVASLVKAHLSKNHPATRTKVVNELLKHKDIRANMTIASIEDLADQMLGINKSVMDLGMLESANPCNEEENQDNEPTTPPADSTTDTDDDDRGTVVSLYRVQATTHHSTTDIQTAIQPVRYPHSQEVQEISRRSSIPCEAKETLHTLPTTQHAFQEILVRKLLRYEPKPTTLADGGANCSATSERDIIHSYREGSNYTIRDCHGTQRPATGEGFLHLRDNRGKLDRVFVIYSEHMDGGTIISPEHHAQHNPDIHVWVQTSMPAEGKGTITYKDRNGGTVSEYDTIRHSGLYYMTETTIVKPTKKSATIAMSFGSRIPASYEATDVYDFAADLTNWNEDEGMRMATEILWPGTVSNENNMEDQIQVSQMEMSNTEHPSLPATEDDEISREDEDQLSHDRRLTERQMLDFELWHQRLGHAGKDKILLTKGCTTGMPDIKLPSTHSGLFKCPACEKAKMHKAPRGPSEPDAHLKPGQKFQMDYGFFRGPQNLPDVVDRTAHPEGRVLVSRQGYTCYLLVICAKTRYVWIFLCKTRHPPIELVDKFLRIHGRHDGTDHCTIRTDGDGALAQSSEFRRMCLHNHGYVVEPTGPDTSSQNGRAERPHRTFADMVRCLLYTAGLGTEFWADALIFAAYIYVRLHHSQLGMSPFQAWTGKKAELGHIRAFGSRVTVKQPGERDTKLDPNHYDGILLRYTATSANVVYYDQVTGKEKIARHRSIDEIHYGEEQRPPGPKHLFSLLSPTGTLGGNKRLKDPMMSLEPLRTVDIPTIRDDTMAMVGMELNQSPQQLAAAAKLQADDAHDVLNMKDSKDIYGMPLTFKLDIRKERHPMLGFVWKTDPILNRVHLLRCEKRTVANRIPRWRGRLRGTVLQSINDQAIYSETQARDFIAQARQDGVQWLTFRFAPLDFNVVACQEVPQLHLDQLRHIHRVLVDFKKTQMTDVTDKDASRPIQDTTPAPRPESNDDGPKIIGQRFTYRQLKKRKDFARWQQAGYAQLDKYKAQNMFGDPIPRPAGATVLPFVWQYSYKEDATAETKGVPMEKARATCNGGKRYGKAVTLAETYATCVEQPASRLFWALVAVLGFVAYGADVGNAFAEAPPPESPFYMSIDEQYRDWWTNHLGLPPIPDGYVLPVNHALQGHPESPRLWEKHINGILMRMGFKHTTHERCIYYKTTALGEFVLILRQVDDFSIASMTQMLSDSIIEEIGDNMIVPLNRLGLIKKFNGVDILQTRDYVKVSCETYITRILEAHGWLDLKAATKPVPIRADSKYMAMLETADRPRTAKEVQELETQMGFGYRNVIGEMVFAMVIARPDLSFTTTKLSQYNQGAAKAHYQAAKCAWAYLNHTRDHGLIYWREKPREDLPYHPPPTPMSNPHDVIAPKPTLPRSPAGYADSDWGSDRETRRSITGMIILLAGAAILWKTRFQPTIALSSTEAEFVAGSDTGKMTLYIRSILKELGFEQLVPTTIYQDNHGAIHMANAQAPTRRTRHVELKHFALLQWVEDLHITFVPVGTAENISDPMTKATGRIKFHQHADVYMGRIPPSYVTHVVNMIKLYATNNSICLHAFDFDPA